MQSVFSKLLTAALMVLFAVLLCHSQVPDTSKIRTEAERLMSQADTLQQAGQIENALELYQLALDKCEQIGAKQEQSQILGNLGFLYNKQRKSQEALSAFKRKLQVERELGNREAQCEVLDRMARIYALSLYDQLEATKYLLESLALARELGNRSLEANALWGLACHYDNNARWDSSLVLAEQCLALYQELEDKEKEGFALNLIGINYKMSGNLGKSLDYLQKSLALFKESGIPRGEFFASGNLATVLGLLGDHQQELGQFQRCLEIARESGDSLILAQGLHAVGLGYIEIRNYAETLSYCREALAIYEAFGDMKNIITTDALIAGAYSGQENFIQAFTHFQRALEMAREIGDIRLQEFVLEQMANTYFQNQNYHKAVECNQEALLYAKKINQPCSIQDNLYSLGKNYFALGNDSQAVVHYERSIEVAESIRDRLRAESQKSTYASQISTFYGDIILLLKRSGQSASAFAYSERGRARSFLDLLASAQVKVGKPKHQEFLSKEAEYADQKQGIEQQIASAGDDSTQAVALRGKLEGDWGEVLASLEEQKRQEPELASLVSVNPLTLPEVQKLLDKETTLLEYFLTEEETLLWLVTRKNAEIFQMDIGGDSLKGIVMTFRKAIQEQTESGELSHQLYDLLIAPAAAKIKTDNLIIVPHGILHYLPFGALQDIQGRCLLEDYRIRYLPSASVLKYLVAKQKGNGERLLALGNPATDRKGFAAIPLTEMEVNEIGASQPDSRVLTGAQATETEFKRLAPQSDILHLACHGDLNSAYPMYSCLLLAPDSVEDGELDVHEIFNLDLHANLVVLSGCQTGLGHLTNGDELVGLSRAFIYAGTPSIVSSLWMVEDESTAYLMGRFYHHLQDHDKAQALRQAQLETRRKYPALRSWASFVLTGEAM